MPGFLPQVMYPAQFEVRLHSNGFIDWRPRRRVHGNNLFVSVVLRKIQVRGPRLKSLRGNGFFAARIFV
jgi:hypothetical protein